MTSIISQKRNEALPKSDRINQINKTNYNKALAAYRDSKAVINDKFRKKYPNASCDLTKEESDAFHEMYESDENYKQCTAELIRTGDILLETDEEFKKTYEENPDDVADYSWEKYFAARESWEATLAECKAGPTHPIDICCDMFGGLMTLICWTGIIVVFLFIVSCCSHM